VNREGALGGGNHTAKKILDNSYLIYLPFAIMKRRTGKKEGTRYSYDEFRPIPYLPPDVIKRLDPWAVLEFFRIEALLRSDLVRKLYHDFITTLIKEGDLPKTFKPRSQLPEPVIDFLSQDPLLQNYRVTFGFGVIKGIHHSYYLGPHKGAYMRESGVLYLEDYYVPGEGFLNLRDIDAEEIIKTQKLENYPRYLWVRLDAAYPPSPILHELKNELTKRHKRLKEIPNPSPSYQSVWLERSTHGHYIHPSKKSPIRSFTIWRQYFRCYDIREIARHSFGAIAKIVYPPGGPQARDRAETAYNRVSRLIEAAEQDKWPPTLSSVK